jgi:hypothetical protein
MPTDSHYSPNQSTPSALDQVVHTTRNRIRCLCLLTTIIIVIAVVCILILRRGSTVMLDTRNMRITDIHTYIGNKHNSLMTTYRIRNINHLNSKDHEVNVVYAAIVQYMNRDNRYIGPSLSTPRSPTHTRVRTYQGS